MYAFGNPTIYYNQGQMHGFHCLWTHGAKNILSIPYEARPRFLNCTFRLFLQKPCCFFGTHAAQIWGTLTCFDATAKYYYSCILIKQDCSTHGKISFVGCYLNGRTNDIWGHFRGVGPVVPSWDKQCPSDHISTLEKAHWPVILCYVYQCRL